jgi:predicted Zn finger-like uncharacterized protein
MPQIIQCPDCQKTLRVPDNLLGKTVRCPTCKTMFTAQAEEEVKLELIDEEPPAKRPSKAEEERDEVRPSRRPAAREEEERVQERPRRKRRELDDEDRPRRKWAEEDEEEDDLEDRLRRSSRAPRGSRTAWRKTRTGVTLVLIGVFTQIAAYALIIVALIMVVAGAASAASAIRSGGSAGAPAGVFGGLGMLCCSGVLLLASFILSVTGNVFCVFTPALNGAKILAIISLALISLQVLFAIIGGIAGGMAGAQAGAASSSMGGGPGPAGPPAMPGSNAFGLIGNFIGLAQFIVFLVFLRQCAVTLRERGTARSILFLIICTGVVVVVSAILVFALILGALAVISSGGGGATGFGAGAIIGLIIILLMALGMLVWYIISLFQIRGAITKFVDG